MFSKTRGSLNLEMALLIALLVLAVVVSLTWLGGGVANTFNNAADFLLGAGGGGGGGGAPVRDTGFSDTPAEWIARATPAFNTDLIPSPTGSCDPPYLEKLSDSSVRVTLTPGLLDTADWDDINWDWERYVTLWCGTQPDGSDMVECSNLNGDDTSFIINDIPAVSENLYYALSLDYYDWTGAGTDILSIRETTWLGIIPEKDSWSTNIPISDMEPFNSGDKVLTLNYHWSMGIGVYDSDTDQNTTIISPAGWLATQNNQISYYNNTNNSIYILDAVTNAASDEYLLTEYDIDGNITNSWTIDYSAYQVQGTYSYPAFLVENNYLYIANIYRTNSNQISIIKVDLSTSGIVADVVVDTAMRSSYALTLFNNHIVLQGHGYNGHMDIYTASDLTFEKTISMAGGAWLGVALDGNSNYIGFWQDSSGDQYAYKFDGTMTQTSVTALDANIPRFHHPRHHPIEVRNGYFYLEQEKIVYRINALDFSVDRTNRIFLDSNNFTQGIFYLIP